MYDLNCIIAARLHRACLFLFYVDGVGILPHSDFTGLVLNWLSLECIQFTVEREKEMLEKCCVFIVKYILSVKSV